MDMKKILALALVCAGAAIAYWGYTMSQSLTGQVTSLMNGGNTDVILRYGVGALLAAIGLFALLKK